MESITYNDEYFRNSDFVDEITSIVSTSLPSSSMVTIPRDDYDNDNDNVNDNDNDNDGDGDHNNDNDNDNDNDGDDNTNINNNDGDHNNPLSTILSNDIIQLLHMKELRIHDILQLKSKEEYLIVQINELKKQYSQLQDIYQQAEYAIQVLVSQEMNEE